MTRSSARVFASSCLTWVPLLALGASGSDVGLAAGTGSGSGSGPVLTL